MPRIRSACLLRVLTTATLAGLLWASCAPAPPPATSPEAPAAAPAPATPAPAPEAAIGMVRVTASAANVRADRSTSSDVVTQVRRGARLTLLSVEGEWMRVRLDSGEVGWIAKSLVSREKRGPCPANAEMHFLVTPTPSLIERAVHGLVVVEASVDVRGVVTATRVVSNDTGDPSLGPLVEREIRSAKFAPPIRDCAPKAFLYTYKRTF